MAMPEVPTGVWIRPIGKDPRTIPVKTGATEVVIDP
jgi:hypothetical protein